MLYQLTSRAFLNFMGQNMWDTFVARAKQIHSQTQQAAATDQTITAGNQTKQEKEHDADYCLYKYLLGRP